MTINKILTAALLSSALLISCGSAPKSTAATSTTTATKPAKTETPAPKFSTVEILNSYPHSTESYTQGLLIHNGKMYESIGEYGHSALVVSDITTGKIEKKIPISREYFAEGLALHQNKLYQLTWMEGKCFVYDVETLRLVETLTYEGEGWGLESYEDKLIMSDGSSTLKFVDPKNFSVISTVEVHDHRGKLDMINELEMVDSLLYANIYLSPLIAVIEPTTGQVLRYIDSSKLDKAIGNKQGADVLNGIAYDSTTQKLYFTGKLWDTLFEVKK